jgi:hypothetical protein
MFSLFCIVVLAKQSDGNYIRVSIEIWICPGKEKVGNILTYGSNC